MRTSLSTHRANAHPVWRWLGLATLGVCVLPLLVASKEHSAAAASPSRSVLLAPARSEAAPPAVTQPSVAVPTGRRADFDRERPSRDAHLIANWAVHSGDNRARPFLIVDKRNAKVYAFDAGGYLRGAAPVLLGLARGDESVPGIGERKMSEIRPYERTTPAGRFVAELGRNTHGEDIVWVDYDSAVSMHRVRANNPKERRLSRLSSATANDNRISYGCINVPVRFYETVLLPTMAGRGAIVYVLPDVRSARDVFGAYDVDERDNVKAKQPVRRVIAQASAKAARPATP